VKRKVAGKNRKWSNIRDRHLKNPDFAREYLLAAVEEGLDLQVAIGNVIRTVGSTRYSKWLKGADRPNLLRTIRKGANPTVKTLAKLLEPLNLELSVVAKG